MAQNNYYTPRLAAVVLLSAMALAGCESLGIKDKMKTDQQIDAALAEAASQPVTASSAEVPPEVAQALMPMPAMRPLQEQDAARTERFDVSAMQVAAPEFFMNLVKGTQFSVVTDPKLDGEISLNMKNVTLEEALDAVSEIYAYEHRRSGNNYLISRPQLQTSMFKVDYLNMKRTGKSSTTVASSGLGEGSTGITLDSESVEDFWKSLQRTLSALIGQEVAEAGGDEEGGDASAVDPLGRVVVVNPQAGVVIVRALPKDLRIVEAFLGQTQAAIVRQVILEAKIIEVELNDKYQQGVNWAALKNPGKWSLDASQTGGGSILSGGGVSEIAGNAGDLAPAAFSAISGADASAFGGVFSLALNYADHFSSFIELLKSQGDVHVLSSPRVAAMNNQKAVIKVGGDGYFVTNVKMGSISESGEQTAPEVELTPFFSGIALDVTPQIDADNNVILHVHPTVSEIQEENKVVDLGTQGQLTLPLAASNVQESDNVVRARSGQIIVIGGLMKERTSDGDASVPGLGDIPGVGNLFKQKLQTRVKKELIILIKPTVVENGQGWNAEAQAAYERVQQMRRPAKKGG